MVPKNLRPLVPYLKRYRTGLLLGGLCVLLTNGIAVQFPQILKRATNDLQLGVTRTKLLEYAAAVVVLFLVKGIFQFLTRRIVIGISRDIEFDMRNDLFAHLEQLSYSYYQRNRTGDIMAKATNDLNAVRNLLGPAIMYSANTIVFTALALAYMLRISPGLTIYAFLPLPIASIIIQYFGRQIHERFERIQAMFSDISARAQENFSGARVIRAYVQEQAEIASFESANKEYIRRSLGLVRLMGMLWPTLELMLGIAMVIVLWVGGRQVVTGLTHVELTSYLGTKTTFSLYGVMDVGGFVAFNTYMAQLMWPVIALGWVINIFQRGTASMGRINQILTEKPEIADEPASSHEPRAASEPVARSWQLEARSEIAGEIEFCNLNFAYNGVPILADVNLRIPAGSSLAIVGPTGSGKTTLVNLIPRIHDASPGAVLIDGRPIREIPLETLRRNIGFVPQETFLFTDTIRENIAFGEEHASFDDVKSAADAANIAGDIESFPENYATMVGERGITLSGGQRQRTSPPLRSCSSRSSTTPSPASTRTPKTKSLTTCAKSCRGAQQSSSRTGCLRSATPTESPSSTTAASSNSAPTTN